MRNVKNLSLCVLLLAMVSTAAGTTLYVPGDYNSIQAAIDEAVSGEDQIEVAPGTYYEAINFNGKAIKLYSSGGPTVTTVDATGIDASVVTCTNGEGSGTILEGFTITGGSGTQQWFGKTGGGMCNIGSSPTVTNCTFSGNHAKGGGMSNDDCSTTVTNCTFSDNTGEAGGGMYNGGANVTVTNCMFSGNSAPYGGGMWNYTASPTVTNCTFSSNTSTSRGSGMYNENDSDPTVTNCTFTSNTGTYGGGGMWNRLLSDPTATNCIFWGNGLGGGQIYNVEDSTPVVTYSDVQLGTGEPWFGTGCIDADPMFADADGRLLAGSPCIDAGNDAAVPSGVTTDLDGNPRIQGACVDMGAFEALAATPEMMLAGLKAYILQQVVLGNIDAEMEVSLLAKVDAAIAALDRDNPNDAKVAMNDLKALINQVEAQTEKKIEAVTAEEIIDRANAIITVLSG